MPIDEDLPGHGFDSNDLFPFGVCPEGAEYN